MKSCFFQLVGTKCEVSPKTIPNPKLCVESDNIGIDGQDDSVFIRYGVPHRPSHWWRQCALSTPRNWTTMRNWVPHRPSYHRGRFARSTSQNWTSPLKLAVVIRDLRMPCFRCECQLSAVPHRPPKCCKATVEILVEKKMFSLSWYNYHLKRFGYLRCRSKSSTTIATKQSNILFHNM